MNSSTLARTIPKSSKSQHRLKDLLSAAQAVFTEHGYQRATMAMIAQETGVSEATVFTYFAGKRELCIQVIKDWYDEITRDLEDTVPRLHGTHARLAHVIRSHLVTLLADGSGMCALVLSEGRSAALSEPELAKVLTDCKRRYTAPLMRCLADAGIPGDVVQLVYGNPDMISRHLLGSEVIRKVSFTGSTAVGKHLMKLAADGAKREQQGFLRGNRLVGDKERFNGPC